MSEVICLSVDTSSSTGSLNLSSDSGLDLSVEWEKKSSHSEVITSHYLALLKKAALTSKEISNLCIDVGPGSFTGIRVGLSFAKTLAYSFSIPTACFSSLEVIAFQSRLKGKVLVTLPAVKDHAYAGGFEHNNGQWTEFLTPLSLSLAELKSWTQKSDHVIDGSDRAFRPKARTLFEYLRRSSSETSYVSWKDISPLYLRRSEAEEKLDRGLLKPIY